MKKCLIIILFFQFLVVAAFAQQSQVQHYIKIETENFRSSPSGKIIGRLNSGTKLKIIQEEGQWVKVQVEGYIWKPSITTNLTEIQGYKIHAMHILLETQAEAQTVLDKVKAGEDFKKLASEFSKDPGAKTNQGDLGYFGKGDLIKEFEDIAFNLNVNETSGIIKTSLGFHIIKRIE